MQYKYNTNISMRLNIMHDIMQECVYSTYLCYLLNILITYSYKLIPYDDIRPPLGVFCLLHSVLFTEDLGPIRELTAHKDLISHRG